MSDFIPWNRTEKWKVALRLEDSDVAAVVILHPKRLSADRQYVEVGGYYCDQLRGALKVEGMEILSVIEVMRGGDSPDPLPPEPKPKRWWHFGRDA